MNQRHAVPKRASLPTQERRTTQEHPQRQTIRHTTAQSPAPVDIWNDEEYASRMPRSARRYVVQDQHPERQLMPAPHPKYPHKQKHPALYIGFGMFGAAVLASLVLGPVGSWWQDQTASWTYGYPRTFQTDAVVGHNDSASHPSHFIALNLRDQILVIEFPGDDPSKGRDFLITTLLGPNADKVPVTLSFADVNGDGKPDLLIHFQGQQIVYINDQGTFRPARPGETING